MLYFINFSFAMARLETKKPPLLKEKLICLGSVTIVNSTYQVLQLDSRPSFNLMISSSDLMRGNEFNNSLTTRYARVQFSTPSPFSRPLNKSRRKLKLPFETSFEENFRHFCASLLKARQRYSSFFCKAFLCFSKLSLAVIRGMHFLFVHTVINLELQIVQLV